MHPTLNRDLITRSQQPLIQKLREGLSLDLPEKVLQFGTGGFLRGFADYLIDKANKQGLFAGRVLVVKSTPGSAEDFDRQDQLYTIHIRDRDISEFILASPISRVLAASADWDAILSAGANPALRIILSNTTEAGLQYQEEYLEEGKVPESYPAKLTAVLYHRYKLLGGDAGSGMVILPCELIVDNGRVLREMVLKLAERNDLPEDFRSWIVRHNHFCNTIVDRIIPGRPKAEQQEKTFASLGYTDKLLIECESYLLWAIEGGPEVEDILEFAGADKRVIICSDIAPYREQKLRLLNGTHTFSVPLAYLCGHETMYGSLNEPMIARFVEGLMQEEIAPTLEGISPEPPAYAREVLARFQNPHIEHRLLNITFQQSTKMKLRNAATIRRYFQRSGTVPQRMALGFAAFLYFMRDADQRAVEDDMGTYFVTLWKDLAPADLVRQALIKLEILDEGPWLDAFAGRVAQLLEQLMTRPARQVLEQFLNEGSLQTPIES